MKVVLLNSGGYGTDSEVDFPVEVDIPDHCHQPCLFGTLVGDKLGGPLVSIPPETLTEVGITLDENQGYLNFFVNLECKIL